jgi:hypothetical protein
MKLTDFEALSEGRQEDLREEASNKGKEVFSRDYDSGGPGGGGYDWVVRYRGLFFAFSLDDIPPGPFSFLRDALDEGGLTDITSATGSITCVGMKVSALLPLLEIYGDDDIALSINGELWKHDSKTGWSRGPDEESD